MPRAFHLLVGLTSLDSGSEFYRQNFPGYDGRRGCEGAVRDIERMHGLAHYLGYESLTPRPLVDELATRASVLAALATLGTPGVLSAGDIVFLYFSCHGRSLGEGPRRDPGRVIGSGVNFLMLRDRPLFNFEIIEQLLKVPRGVRLFVLVDACHAGLGTNLAMDRSDFVRPYAENSLQSILRRVDTDPFLSGFRVQNNQGLRILQFDGGTPPVTLPDPAIIQLSIVSISNLFQELLRFFNANVASAPQIAHFGAARDEAKARGDRSGSLFTRAFYNFFVESGHEHTYHSFFTELAARLPAQHPPVAEYLVPPPGQAGPGVVAPAAAAPARPPALDMIPPPSTHFASRESVLQIL